MRLMYLKILGFGKAIIGLATVLLGIRFLKNPFKLIKDDCEWCQDN